VAARGDADARREKKSSRAGSLPTVSDQPMRVLVRRLDPGVPLPAYARPGDAGADLVSTTDVLIAPGERALVGTGLAIALPQGYAAFVHPRSGLALRAGLTMVNAPGTIDSGYRGEIQVNLLNTDRRSAVQVRRGDRIAQLVIQRVEHARFELAEMLPGSARGESGHGSTGGADALGRRLRDGVR
jgi:dUTP pyrophosphatase